MLQPTKENIDNILFLGLSNFEGFCQTHKGDTNLKKVGGVKKITLEELHENMKKLIERDCNKAGVSTDRVKITLTPELMTAQLASNIRVFTWEKDACYWLIS